MDSLWLISSVLLLVYQGSCHYRYFSQQANFYVMPKTEKEMLSWLNKQTPKDSVVLTASLKYNLLIPALAHNNVFLPYSQYSIASQEEAFERFFILYKLLNVSQERVREMFTQTPENEALIKIKRYSYDDCGGNYFYYLKYKKRHSYSCEVSKDRLEEITKGYQSFTFKPKISLLKYQADYLLISPYEKKWSKTNLEDYSFLKLVEKNNDFQLYQIQI